MVDGHFLSRGGLSAFLRREIAFDHVHEFCDVEGAVRFLAEGRGIDLVLLDLALEIPLSVGGLAGFRQSCGDAALAVIDSRRDRNSVFSCLDAGARGFLPREMSEAEMTHAILSLLAGHIFVPPAFADFAPSAQPGTRTSGEPDPTSELTERQWEVLLHLSHGKSNKEIARALRISESTVKVHLAAAFRHLGVRNRVGAVTLLQTGRLVRPAGLSTELPDRFRYGRRRQDQVHGRRALG